MNVLPIYLKDKSLILSGLLLKENNRKSHILQGIGTSTPCEDKLNKFSTASLTIQKTYFEIVFFCC